MPKYFISIEAAQLLRDNISNNTFDEISDDISTNYSTAVSVFDFNGELEHHLVKVLRIRVGEEVLLCDGRGTDFYCVVTHTAPLMLATKSICLCKTEPDYKVTLYQGMPKAGKMELIIQKAVELGVWAIVPVIMERSVSHSKKEKRYQKIAEAAAGQSMRGIIPKVYPPMSWKEAFSQKPIERIMLAAYENEEERTLKGTLREIENWKSCINEQMGQIMQKRQNDVGVWIGPEGGFSEREVREMQNEDFKLFSLGPRILRTETAGIAALAQFFILNTDF